MAIDPQDAASSLSDVERVERKTRENVRYGYGSTYQLMWGVLVTAGYLVEWAIPRQGVEIWATVFALGILGGLILRFRRARVTGGKPEMRIVYSQIVLVAFGILWTAVLTDATPRQIGTLWPTFYMFSMILFGIWVGRFFVYLGAIVTVLVVAAYLWAGEAFLPVMAVANGGALIASGLYLRRHKLAR